MKIIMSRSYDLKETRSTLFVMEGVDKLFECCAIELPKVFIPYPVNAQNVTCIPEGTYPVQRIYSPTKGKCFLLYDVPGRSAVEIHIGNFATGKKVDTEGCILPGMRFVDINKDGNLDVQDSTKAMEKLLELLPDHFELIIM